MKLKEWMSSNQWRFRLLVCSIAWLCLSGIGNVNATHIRPVDLYFTALTVNPTSMFAGRTVSVTFTIYNSSTSASASNFAIRLYYSRDATIIPQSDTYLNSEYIHSSLGARQSFTRTMTFTVPGSIPLGAGYVGAYVDATFRVSEGSESNNGRAVAITALKSAPDLLWQSSTVPLTSNNIPQGGSFEGNYTLANQGLAFTQDFTIDYYYCTSTTVASCTTKLGSQVVTEDFPIGHIYTFTSPKLTMPATATVGNGYIRAFADAKDEIKNEISETNNDDFDPVTILPPRPDARATVLTVSPKSVFETIQMNIKYKVENIGSQAATNFTIRLYHSTDATITTSDTYLNHERTLTLAPGASTQEYSVNITTPKLTIGPGYIGILVDYTNALAESNEINNSKSDSITITDTVDLQALTIRSARTYQVVGGKATFNYEIKNTGKSVINQYEVGFYYSQTSSITTSSTLLKVEKLTLLPPGVTEFGSITVDIPASAKTGTGYIGFIIDPNNKMAELSKSNNTANTSVTFAEDKDKDGFAYLPGCPSTITDCDCKDDDKAINPKAKEVCNGKDDNCDGQIEGALMRPCYTGKPGTEKTAPCKAGMETCSNGQWSACVGEVIPKNETCDKADNDCDGQIDNGLNCNEPKAEPTAEPTPEPTTEPTPEPMAEPKTEPLADAGAEPTPEKASCTPMSCPNGQMCVNGFCVPIPPMDGPAKDASEGTPEPNDEPTQDTQTSDQGAVDQGGSKDDGTGDQGTDQGSTDKGSGDQGADQTTTTKDEGGQDTGSTKKDEGSAKDEGGGGGCSCDATNTTPFSLLFFGLILLGLITRRSHRRQ